MRVAGFVPLERFGELGVREDLSQCCELVAPTFEAGSVFVDSAVTHRAATLSRTPRSEPTLSSSSGRVSGHARWVEGDPENRAGWRRHSGVANAEPGS